MDEELLNALLKEESENYEDGDYFKLFRNEDNNWSWKPQEKLKKLIEQVYIAAVNEGYTDGYDHGLQDGQEDQRKQWYDLFDLAKLKQQIKVYND